MVDICKIIMYHYVRPIKDSCYQQIKGLEVESFKRQLRFFKENFQFITTDQLLDGIYKNTKLVDKAVLLTFDDGLKDHYTYVYPVLKNMSVQGSFFPPVKPIKENKVLDVHKIHFILANTKNVNKLVLKIFNFIKKNQTEFNLDEPKKYFNKLAEESRFDSKETIFIKRILQRELPVKLRNEIIDKLFRENVTENEEDFANQLYMNIEEMKEMREGGMYFGSHSYSHNWLTTLSERELKIELEKSLSFHHDVIKNNDDLIMCYPYGNYNRKIIQELKKYHFKAGLTTEVGNAILDKRNAYCLMRYDTNDFPQK